jgi:hypothetical protein
VLIRLSFMASDRLMAINSLISYGINADWFQVPNAVLIKIDRHVEYFLSTVFDPL